MPELFLCRCSNNNNKNKLVSKFSFNHCTQMGVMMSIPLPVSMFSMLLWTELFVCVFAALHVCKHVSVFTCKRKQQNNSIPIFPVWREVWEPYFDVVQNAKITHVFQGAARVLANVWHCSDLDCLMYSICCAPFSGCVVFSVTLTVCG